MRRAQIVEIAVAFVCLAACSSTGAQTSAGGHTNPLGTNLGPTYAYDKDGHYRGDGGWDIGAYAYP